MAQNNYEAPPILTTDIKYEVRKKEVEIWRLVTSIDKKKRAPDTFIVFAKEAIVGLDINGFLCDQGVENRIEKFDKLYLKDSEYYAYEAYE